MTGARVAVLGSGSWGTAFGKVMADAGCEVRLWARRPELAAAVTEQRENPDYLPGVRLPDLLSGTADCDEALAGAEVVVLAVPSQSLRGNLEGWRERLRPDALLVSLLKGVERGTALRMSEVVAEVARVEPDRVAVVSGPNLAREVAAGQPAATVVACTDPFAGARLQAACHTSYFRPYTNEDVVGCELGGAVKNVIALGVGIATGLGLGDSTRATIMTRGLAETVRLGVELGANPLTFGGLAGLGDLAATCFSPLSRNRTFGQHLGEGRTVAETTAVTRQTAEGVHSAASVLQLAERAGVEMPIAQAVAHVVGGELTPHEAMLDLLGRDAGHERAPVPPRRTPLRRT